MSRFGGMAPKNAEENGGPRDMSAECPFCGETLSCPLPYHLPCTEDDQ